MSEILGIRDADDSPDEPLDAGDPPHASGTSRPPTAREIAIEMDRVAQDREGKSCLVGGAGLIVVMGLMWFACDSVGPTEAERKARAEQERVEAIADRKAGFHCLSKWDGSPTVVVREVKKNLHDANSFEHVETRISPVGGDRTHSLTMDYRAANLFGAQTLQVAHAIIRNQGCSVVSLRTFPRLAPK